MADVTDEIPTLNLDELPTQARELIAAIADKGRVALAESGVTLGVLDFRPVPGHPASDDENQPQIVVTAMELPREAQDQLKDALGPGFVVMDLHEAPRTADIVLVHAVSPQLLAHLKASFPGAELVVAEISDPSLGIDFAGPVSRLMEAGATGYIPPRSVADVAIGVRRHAENRAELTGGSGAAQLAAAPDTPG